MEKILLETQGWLIVMDGDSCNALINYFDFFNEKESERSSSCILCCSSEAGLKKLLF